MPTFRNYVRCAFTLVFLLSGSSNTSYSLLGKKISFSFCKSEIIHRLLDICSWYFRTIFLLI